MIQYFSVFFSRLCEYPFAYKTLKIKKLSYMCIPNLQTSAIHSKHGSKTACCGDQAARTTSKTQSTAVKSQPRALASRESGYQAQKILYKTHMTARDQADHYTMMSASVLPTQNQWIAVSPAGRQQEPAHHRDGGTGTEEREEQLPTGCGRRAPTHRRSMLIKEGWLGPH